MSSKFSRETPIRITSPTATSHSVMDAKPSRRKSSNVSNRIKTETRVVNGVRTEIRTETINEDGEETVKVYENNVLVKTTRSGRQLR